MHAMLCYASPTGPERLITWKWVVRAEKVRMSVCTRLVSRVGAASRIWQGQGHKGEGVCVCEEASRLSVGVIGWRAGAARHGTAKCWIEQKRHQAAVPPTSLRTKRRLTGSSQSMRPSRWSRWACGHGGEGAEVESLGGVVYQSDRRT